MFLSKVSFIKNGVHFLDDVIIFMLILHISSESFWKVQGISLDLRISPGAFEYFRGSLKSQQVW